MPRIDAENPHRCPACGKPSKYEVPMGVTANYRCEDGHRWSRTDSGVWVPAGTLELIQANEAAAER